MTQCHTIVIITSTSEGTAINNNIVCVAVLLIGVITFILSAVGVKIGSLFGSKYKSTAELVGGIVLVLLGVKILVEGLFSIDIPFI